MNTVMTAFWINNHKPIPIEWQCENLSDYTINEVKYPIAYKILNVVGYTLSNIQIANHLVLYHNGNEYVFNMSIKDLTGDDKSVLQLIKQATLQNFKKSYH
jgi:hypothetical protein